MLRAGMALVCRWKDFRFRTDAGLRMPHGVVIACAVTVYLLFRLRG